MGARVVTINEVLAGHAVLDIECLDRVYLNAYVPILQSSGQVVAFMTQHLDLPIPSPALFDKIGQKFRRAVASFAETNHIPWVRFTKDHRKADVMRPYLDLPGALLAQRTEVDGGPGAVGPPSFGEFGEAAAGAILLVDLGVQPAFVMGQRVGGVRAAEHDQFGSERAESLDLLHALDGMAGVHCAQRRPVQHAFERGLGDCAQILTFTARKVQVEPGQGMRRREGAILAVAGGELSAQPGGLHDVQPLRQYRPRRGLIGGMEAARPQSGQSRLRVGDHRVTAGHRRPATPVDVQRQEPAHLRGGSIKITVASQRHARGIPGLGHHRLGAVPVPLDTKHRAQRRPGLPACQCRGSEALPESPAGLQRPRAYDLELGHTSCHRLLRSIGTRRVANGTDTKPKVDLASGTEL